MSTFSSASIKLLTENTFNKYLLWYQKFELKFTKTSSLVTLFWIYPNKNDNTKAERSLWMNENSWFKTISLHFKTSLHNL